MSGRACNRDCVLWVGFTQDQTNKRFPPTRLVGMTETNTTLTPTQSLALRRFIEALKADDSLYNAFPEAIRGLIADIHLGGYSTAEQTIMDLEAALEADMRIFEKLAAKIKSLEAEVVRRRTGPTDGEVYLGFGH